MSHRHCNNCGNRGGISPYVIISAILLAAGLGAYGAWVWFGRGLQTQVTTLAQVSPDAAVPATDVETINCLRKSIEGLREEKDKLSSRLNGLEEVSDRRETVILGHSRELANLRKWEEAHDTWDSETVDWENSLLNYVKAIADRLGHTQTVSRRTR